MAKKAKSTQAVQVGPKEAMAGEEGREVAVIKVWGVALVWLPIRTIWPLTALIVATGVAATLVMAVALKLVG